jgi:thiamine-phosphate pyrophosphorylase
VIRCLITDGTYSSDSSRWLTHIAHWIGEGVELIQLRERDLSARDLADLTRKVLRINNPHGTKILLNDRADVAIACGASGVHLRDNAPAAERFKRNGSLVSMSCHSPGGTPEDAPNANAADYVLLAPIFKPLSKHDQRPVLGTRAIEEFVRRSSTPVLALGGITHENARACVDAGAAGIAGITYFALGKPFPLPATP